MQVLSADQTRRLLSFHKLPAYIAQSCADMAAGHLAAPERLKLGLPGNAQFMAMPAADRKLAIAKLICVHPGNPAQGRPMIQGDVVVFDACSGERLAILDGPTVTERRTAAVSLYAASRLRPGPIDEMLVVGAGPQARAHIEGFAATREIGRIRIASRSVESARKLAASLRPEFGNVEVADDLAAAVRRAVLIVTATSAVAPVIPHDVRDDVLIVAVGAYRADMIEIPGALVQRAQLAVDDDEGARHEAGDLIQAGIEWSRVVALKDIDSARFSSGRPVMFKSVGCAGWDLAAAHLAIDELALLKA
jgi:1-piperideine-2-carboxylate/1-pyrroline-2-carboxylate reductase [NAD(P)H]